VIERAFGSVPRIAERRAELPSPVSAVLRPVGKQVRPRDPYLALEAAFARRIEGRGEPEIADQLGLASEPAGVRADLRDGSRSARRYVVEGDALFQELGAWPWRVLTDGERPETRWWEDGEKFVPPLLDWYLAAKRETEKILRRAADAEEVSRGGRR
jgi:hypothetical protein